MRNQSLVTLLCLIGSTLILAGCPKNAPPVGAPKSQKTDLPAPSDTGLPKGAPTTPDGKLDVDALKKLAWMEHSNAYSADGTDFRWGDPLPDGGKAMGATPPYDPAIPYPDLAIQPKDILTKWDPPEEPAAPQPEKRESSSGATRGGTVPPAMAERPESKDVDPAVEWAPVPIPAGPFKVKSRTFTYHGDNLNLGGVGAVPDGPGLFPVVMLVHGYIPAERYTVDSMRREAEFLAARGYTAIVPDFRNYGGSDKVDADEELRRLGYLRDVLNMVQVVRLGQIPEGDPTKLALVGWGHGGSLALKTAILVHPMGVVSVSGTGLQEALDHDLFAEYMAPEAAAGEDALYGKPDNPAVVEWYNKMSLASFLDKMQCPSSFIQGERDPITPAEWPRAMMGILTPLGLPVQSSAFPRVGHAFYGQDWVGEMQSITNFLNPIMAPPAGPQ
ncbi:MAG: alpha/beta fold hydrolase [bacterium]